MASVALNYDKQFTWADYLGWPDDERWEIINGIAYDMSPSPSFKHQDTVRLLAHSLSNHFQGKKCTPIISPMDLKLDDFNVVQPDLMVVCEPNQIKDKHIEGPPTLIIEVLSPSNAANDRVRKMNLYAKFGVKEYWIVTPFPPLVEVYILEGKHYYLHGGYEEIDVLKSPTFSDLEINLKNTFTYPLTDDEKKILEAREPKSRYGS